MEKQVKAVKIITIVSVIIMFVSIIVLSCQLIKIANIKQKNTELQLRKEQLIEEIYNYNTTNSYYDNNREEYLQDYAREYLGWGEKDETWYTSN